MVATSVLSVHLLSVDDGFAVVVPMAFDEDVDDKVSESHCSGGTSCIADADPMNSDSGYTDVHLGGPGSCSGCCCCC